jgi:hypothetical protein
MGLSWFLLLPLLLRQICNNLYRDLASRRYKTMYTLTNYLLLINLVPRHSYRPQSMYLDGKNHAIPSLHRDSIVVPLSRVTGLCPDASSSNAHAIIPPGR